MSVLCNNYMLLSEKLQLTFALHVIWRLLGYIYIRKYII